MADVVSAETRSRMMSGIRGKNTKPELLLRKLLHARGFRYRLHTRLPGKPDLVFPKHRAVIFVHGCFWHRHECQIFKWPSTRSEFWRTKINGNADRDQRNVAVLLKDGWRIGIVWECSLRGKDEVRIADRCARWLSSGNKRLEI
ncbi:very short patch repair endonuclease [Bradyrhizobium ivorense]|uniref:very short patch repair endonuclease n=1 Tax=Bradyrhizobium ivorense TaxID=2511166 RepID=UPI0010B19964|nr:very short patch repair endonuclease [Bradyrhizobium ivorense]VIO80134.1 Very short patch repair protein [Bradyrhizobium ivorense]